MASFTVACLLACVLGSTLAVDLTMSPEADGRIVVDAVVSRIRSKCIFADDRLFLRRVAYVESSDGEAPHTYRNGFHGGIWQVDQARFLVTKACPSRIRDECDLIETEFGIRWCDVEWQDLRKPLYSGLAAALYMSYRFTVPPGNLRSQAFYWRWFFHPGGSYTEFVTKGGNLPGNDCNTQLDLAFIIDGSGSVSGYNFRRMLTFIQNVTSELKVSRDAVQVAAVEFSTIVGTPLYFSNFTNKTDLLNSISCITKGDGWTNTHLALDKTADVIFNSETGARPNAKRVAILLTDGASQNFSLTVQSAQKVKDKGITMFTVGVGSINLQEIQSVASEPNCTHVSILSTFTEIDSLLYELRDSSCHAPKVMTGTDTTATNSLPENTTVTEIYEAQPPSGGNGGATTPDGDGGNNEQPVVKCEAQCGSLEIYGSYETPRPGPAFYDIKESARVGRPAVIYLNTTLQGRSLYVTVVGSRLPVTASDVAACVDAGYTITMTTVTRYADVVCRLDDEERDCTKADLKNSPYSNLLCDDEWRDIISPCTASGSETIHAHPSDLTKFIRCDVRGKMYITQCPGDETYNSNTESCGHEAIGGDNSTSLPGNLANPCTQANLAASRFYFPYPGDVTQYIQCDVWGRSWVKPCPAGLNWNDAITTCTSPTSSKCNGTNNGAHFAHSDRKKFIQCAHGQEVVKSCPSRLEWNTSTNQCDWPQTTNN